MKPIEERLSALSAKMANGEEVSCLIMGLGSVGTYLLDYLVGAPLPVPLKVIAAGRNGEKLESDVNIVRISALIRGQNKSRIIIESGVDFYDEQKTAEVIARHNPDFIVNSSRVYSGLKYGSISWSNLRAYGIWTPLAVSIIRHIMAACEAARTNAIVINTSYSDAVIPWLKSAALPYPDFGSGNLNHLVPRIQYAAAEILSIADYWNIDVRLATAHFHDVVISKEGQTEGQNPLLFLSYKGAEIKLDAAEIYKRCKIAMPVDAERNMMNASSNFGIINSFICALKHKQKNVFHSPGAFGNIGGYPVCVDGTGDAPRVFIDESKFPFADMIAMNKRSLALDGIESVEKGTLVYTDALIGKVKKAFNAELPKYVPFDAVDETARFIIEKIIKPNCQGAAL